MEEIMASVITAAKAYANNEVAVVAWDVAQAIDGCLGFELTRIYQNGDERPLAAWVPFEGQKNPKWLPQTTSVWPVQKLMWRDLTVRKRRDKAELRPADVTVKYRIRAVVKQKPGLKQVTNVPPISYEGDPVPLSYVDDGIETNEVTITGKYNDIQVAFTNGILAAQWLGHALQQQGEKLTIDNVRKHIQTPGDPIRTYLTGDVLELLKTLFERADKTPNPKLLMALYELQDQELVDLIVANAKRVRLILSNSSQDRNSKEWDATNQKARQTLMKTPGLEIHHRMFNNSGHIGHNKFVVLLSGSKPQAVLTGSTNWTSTGLCGQTNNSILLDSADVANEYATYWNNLLADTETFDVPNPISNPTSNVQRKPLRQADAGGVAPVNVKGTDVHVWYSPNTTRTTKGTDIPPDLEELYSLMRKAEQAILFAVFLPSRSGKTSVIEQAINIGMQDSSILVYGAISDPTAMPNYVAPTKGSDDEQSDDETVHRTSPWTYDKGNVHIVRASALTQQDIVGQFDQELLKVGNAIIHDKVVVVDPLSPNGFAAMGSHNLGYKASYCNDDQVLIVRNNQPLVMAYAVHVLDVCDHYRFRAMQAQLRDEHKKQWDGFLSLDSKWLEDYLASDRGNLARYLAHGTVSRVRTPAGAPKRTHAAAAGGGRRNSVA
jgi:phosphatidylserine/phosphatidylglycerophosphate/cardiolipin synthase-like enzyme